MSINLTTNHNVLSNYVIDMWESQTIIFTRKMYHLCPSVDITFQIPVCIPSYDGRYKTIVLVGDAR